GRESQAEAIFKKWGLDFAVIGRTTDTGRMVVRHNGVTEADIPVASLADSAPLYDRPWKATEPSKALLAEWVPPPPNGILSTLNDMMGSHALASRRWIWDQYDHMVMGDTLQRPGGDAAVVRIHGSDKAIAATCDCTPRYVAADPAMGAKQAVIETWRNLTAVGAKPLAITDNLNFASPERPEVMGQIVGAIRGMGEACRVLDYPVVSGNVSLYNETNGAGIPPTPAIGGVGVIHDHRQTADIALKSIGGLLIVIGREQGWLGQSLYQQHVSRKYEGAPPAVDLADELKAGHLVRSLIKEGKTKTVHDCSDGGLLVTIAEMALAGNTGVELYPYEGKLPSHAIWFGEDQGRYVLEVSPDSAEKIADRARLLALPARIIGRVGGDTIKLPGEPDLPLSTLRQSHEGWLPDLMSSA
ncbi:MAG: AIR synthase related protein, partial [Pseudomonadota bacterium]